MKASTTILSGTILVFLGIALTMAPGLFAGAFDLFTFSDSTVDASSAEGVYGTLVGVITGNFGLLIGLLITLFGLIYIFFLPVLSYSANLDMKIISFASLLIVISLMVGLISEDFEAYGIAEFAVVTFLASVFLVALAPFGNKFFPWIFKDRRDFEEVKISADKLFSYAVAHHKKLQQLQDKITDLEKQEEILKNLMGEEKIDSVFKIIDRRERNNRISTFVFGIATGVISTFISELILW